MLSNPPFGVEWKKVEAAVRKEHDSQGFNGRFGNLSRHLGEAAKWYRRAAERGSDQSQYLLGMMLVEGRGVRRSSRSPCAPS